MGSIPCGFSETLGFHQTGPGGARRRKDRPRSRYRQLRLARLIAPERRAISRAYTARMRRVIVAVSLGAACAADPKLPADLKVSTTYVSSGVAYAQESDDVPDFRSAVD